MRSRNKILFIILLLFYGLVDISAQRPLKNGGSDDRVDRDTSRSKPRPDFIRPPDTLKIQIYKAEHPERKESYPDTMLGYFFQQSDPTRQQTIDYVHLGSMGTPARPLFYQTKEREGIQLGFHQFDLYKRDVKDIRYFNVNRTFTDTHYAQNHTKDDFFFKGTFSRDLAPNWNIGVDYDRISHLGVYSHQKSRHTAFAINTAHENKKGNYKAFASYSYNDLQQEDNGGITTDSLFGSSFYSERANIPVYSKIAKTRMQEQILAYTHYYDFLAPKRDSLGKYSNKRHLTFGHQFLYTPGSYKFYDTSPDTLFYGNLQIDDRGLRQFLNWDKVKNTVKLSTFKLDESKNQPKDSYTAGLFHIYQKTNQEPIDTSINSLFLFGEWDYNPAKFLSLRAYAHYGIGNNSNEYLLKGDLTLDLGKIGIINGNIINQRFAPDLLQTQAYISKREIYNNDFVKPITTSINASYHLPVSKTTASVNYHLLNNHIYYDTLALAQQATAPISILQFIVQQDFRFGVFGMDNTIALQTDNSDVIRAPTLFVKNSIYLEGNIFKRVMFARIGFDFRMNTSYFADAYQPVIGQFHLQDDTEIKLYPALDVFLSFKVQTFRGFAKMENITGWFTNDIYYQTPNHPLADPHFRFGVSWRFID